MRRVRPASARRVCHTPHMLHVSKGALVAVLLATPALGGCASLGSASDAPVAVSPAARPRELVRLRTRDADVAVLLGSGGERVRVYAKGGDVAVGEASIDELGARDPDVAEMLRRSVASRQVVLDATLTRAP